jgi:hypothetical protein
MKGITFKINGELSEEGKKKLLKHIEEGRKKMEARIEKYRKYFDLLEKMNKDNRHEDFIYLENGKHYIVSWDSGKWSDPREITFLE